jgi:hypothetical protein
MEMDLSSRVVIEDMPCARCGYNLRTLTFLHRCPECGEMVAASYFGRGGRRQNRMGRVAGGAGLVAFVLLCLVGNAMGEFALQEWPALRGWVSVGGLRVPLWLEWVLLPTGVFYLAYSRLPKRWYDDAASAICMTVGAVVGLLVLETSMHPNPGARVGVLDPLTSWMHVMLLATGTVFLQTFCRSLWRGRTGVLMAVVHGVLTAAALGPFVLALLPNSIKRGLGFGIGHPDEWMVYVEIANYGLLFLIWAGLALAALRMCRDEGLGGRGAFPVDGVGIDRGPATSIR